VIYLFAFGEFQMRKELNPGLFAGASANPEGLIELKSTSAYDISGVELSSLNPANDLKRLEKKVENITQESRVKHEEMLKAVQTRFEAFVQKLTALESKFEALSQDIRSKHSVLSGKVTERHMTDMKTQALIDRHTQLLRQFEQRVAGLQRVIEEQEYQIMNYKAALDESRKEMARMKRL
jgi:chromosome segregation ATPase